MRWADFMTHEATLNSSLWSQKCLGATLKCWAPQAQAHKFLSMNVCWRTSVLAYVSKCELSSLDAAASGRLPAPLSPASAVRARDQLLQGGSSRCGSGPETALLSWTQMPDSAPHPPCFICFNRCLAQGALVSLSAEDWIRLLARCLSKRDRVRLAMSLSRDQEDCLKAPAIH